tara:strand:+ start:2398 stop:3099 length:702 start_codon:yes stop_codon:yes gene_type:complete
MANRTLQFYGYAYGDVPVQLNAHINGQLVFSGPVATTAGPIPVQPIDMDTAPVLFSVVDSALYPTSYSGAYPMTVSVATGNGIALMAVWSNYQHDTANSAAEFSGSISGTTLTVSSVTSGEVQIGQHLHGTGVTEPTTIVSGNGSSWVVSASQTVGETTINGAIHAPGTADVFDGCFWGTPTNSEGTVDPRSSVRIDNVPQVPPLETSTGCWCWVVDSGSTLECNLNVSEGNE